MSSMYKVTVPRNERGNRTIGRLNVSIGQDYHEGKKLAATIGWMGRHFNRVVINLCDTLQRHNLEGAGLSPQSAHRMALANGNQWLDRNQGTIDCLPDYTVTRWDDWRDRTDWAAAHDTIMALYNNDPNFKRVADTTAHDFLARRTFANDTARGLAYEQSLKYILEEATFALVSSDPKIAEIYPGTFPPIFDYMRDHGLNAPQSMTGIAFKRRKLKIA